MIFLYILAVKYYVKYYSQKNEICHPLSPCSYAAAEKLLKNGDEVFIKDRYLSSKSQLNAFRTFIEKISNIGVKVYSNGTIINGITAPFLKCFISIANSSGFTFSGFNFVNFAVPILSISNTNLIYFSNISIISCKISSFDSFFTIKNTSALFSNLNVQQTSTNFSKLFNFIDSKVLFDQTYMIQNFAFHMTDIPFISCTNSKFIIRNSNFIRCMTQFSSFISSNDNSLVKILNSKFDESRHLGLIRTISGKSSNLIDNCEFIKYYDSVIIAEDELADTSITNSKFNDNFGYDMNSFTINSGKLSISNASFVDDSGIPLFHLSGAKSILSVEDSKFSRNKMTNHLVSCSNQASMSLKSLEIENNYFGNYSIYSLDCNAFVDSMAFHNNRGTVLYADKGKFDFTNNNIEIYDIFKDLQPVHNKCEVYNDKGTEVKFIPNPRNPLPNIINSIEKSMYPVITPRPIYEDRRMLLMNQTI